MSHMPVKLRQRIERNISSRLIRDAIAAGYTVGVDNGEETYEPSKHRKGILDLMFQTDEETLTLHKDGKRVGWVALIYGNGAGHDVIHDYSTNLNDITAGAFKLADKYAE